MENRVIQFYIRHDMLIFVIKQFYIRHDILIFVIKYFYIQHDTLVFIISNSINISLQCFVSIDLPKFYNNNLSKIERLFLISRQQCLGPRTQSKCYSSLMNNESLISLYQRVTDFMKLAYVSSSVIPQHCRSSVS